MKLQAVKPFSEYGIAAQAGAVVEFSDALGIYLRENFPGSWIDYVQAFEPPAPVAVIEVETEALDEPPADKMIHKPVRHKAKR